MGCAWGPPLAYGLISKHKYDILSSVYRYLIELFWVFLISSYILRNFTITAGTAISTSSVDVQTQFDSVRLHLPEIQNIAVLFSKSFKII